MPTARPSYWWQLLFELFKWQPVGQPPFRRSVAFLVGVSRYKHISQQLDFVKADLTELRNFLLTEGGFDVVYEVRDENVSYQLIDDFMGRYFSNPNGTLGPQDRLLFYYSGHGGAQADVEPYLLFHNARPPDDFTDALPVRDVYRWARTIVAKHLLIILDSCFSGLTLGDKAGPDDMTAALANALAGEPSGLLLTAGTGDEKAYAFQYSKQNNGSIFTHSLIDALRNMAKSEGIVTIGEAFERAKVTVAAYDAVEGRKMTPLPRPLPRRDGLGKGNFIFINSKADNPRLPSGLRGLRSAITKAPDNAEPTLSLIQKEYDEVKNSDNLAALRAFDSTYKGQPFGQTLVNIIEERISRLVERPTLVEAVHKDVITDPGLEMPKPKNLLSDLAYVGKVARLHRLRQLRGQARGSNEDTAYFSSTFLVTDANQCDVNISKTTEDSNLECYFSNNKFSVSDLYFAVKSALPELTWGNIDATAERSQTVEGKESSLSINIVRFRVDPYSIHLYFYPR
jgi:hypothetical protein